MAIDIEERAGGRDSNAYVSVDDAREHAAYRIGGAAFLALTNDQMAQALITAAGDIDAVGDEFRGERATSAQAMEWPRTGTQYGSDEIPANLVKANIELAMTYVPAFAAGYTGDVLNRDATNGNVKRKKVGPLETEYFAAAESSATAVTRFPPVVQRLLASLVETVETGWGSASVARSS